MRSGSKLARLVLFSILALLVGIIEIAPQCVWGDCPVITDAGARTEHLAGDGEHPERVLLNLEARVRDAIGLKHLKGVQAKGPDGKSYELKPDTAQPGHYTLEAEAPASIPAFLVFTAGDRKGRASLPDTVPVGRVLPLPRLEVDMRASPTLVWTPVERAARVEVALSDARGKTLASRTVSNPYILSFTPKVMLREGSYTFTLTAYDTEGNLSRVSRAFRVK